MKEKISELLMNYLEDCTKEEVMKWIMIPPTKEMGDYSLPCFQLAKKLKQSPKQIAMELKESIESEEKATFIHHVEVVNGYLNLYLEQSWYLDWLLQGSVENVTKEIGEGEGKTICIDYSSPNIAKNFHIGHLRTTIIGNSLCQIFKKLGYQVVGINYYGDWGTQFGKLIVAYQKWGEKEKVDADGLDELLRLYVLFHEKQEEHPELLEEARDWFLKLEQKDPEAIKLWKWFIDISLVEFQKIYDLLKIQFDSYQGESYATETVPQVVQLLKEKHLIKESEGANVVFLNEFDLPPCLITKTNGTSIYPSRDLATVLNRKKTYAFERCLYVTGAEQQLHFNQVFHVIQKMGYEWWKDLVHVPYGLVSFQGEKLSSRNGTMVFAKDLLQEAMTRAKTIIEEKNPTLDKKEEVAQQVGIGAIIFHDLFNVKIKNVSFVWDQVLNFDGATGPYVQYTCARASSILTKNKIAGIPTKLPKSEYYADSASVRILELLTSYQETIKEAADRYEPCVITRYAYALAQAFNQFYQECNIQNSEPECKEARLFLTSLAYHTMKEAMALLGIECPTEM